MGDQISAVLYPDREFHLFAYPGTPRMNLRRMIDKFWNMTQHHRRIFTERSGIEGMWIINCEHRLHVEAIRRRDEDESERSLLGHIRRTRLDLMRRTKEHP